MFQFRLNVFSCVLYIAVRDKNTSPHHPSTTSMLLCYSTPAINLKAPDSRSTNMNYSPACSSSCGPRIQTFTFLRVPRCTGAATNSKHTRFTYLTSLMYLRTSIHLKVSWQFSTQNACTHRARILSCMLERSVPWMSVLVVGIPYALIFPRSLHSPLSQS